MGESNISDIMCALLPAKIKWTLGHCCTYVRNRLQSRGTAYYAMLEMIRDEDGADYNNVDENDLGEGDVDAPDGSSGKGGQPPHGAVHEACNSVEHRGKDGGDA